MRIAYLLGIGGMMVGAAACRAAEAGGAPQPAAMEVPGAPRDSLQLSLEVPAQVRRGQSVPMTLRVRNVLSRPVTLAHGGRPLSFDIVVTRADGTHVWSHMERRGVVDILWRTTFAPGQVVEFTDTWNQRAIDGAAVAPGTYSVQGSLYAVDERLATPAAALHIVP